MKELTEEFIRNNVDCADPIERKWLAKRLEEYHQEALQSLAEETLPDSYYAGMNSEERFKILVDHWRRAVETNRKLENDLEAIRLNLYNWIKENINFDKSDHRTEFMMNIFKDL